MIDANKILLINCSKPNYNLAVDKMKIYFGDRATIVDDVLGLFTPDHDAVCLSVIFSWDVPFAVQQAKISLSRGKKVMIGGGGTQQLHNWIEKETGIKPHYKVHPDLENVEADFKMVYFTRGCVQNCYWCTVPRIEGHNVTLNYKSRPAKFLMDNNLSQIPQPYQEYIVQKYLEAGITSVDCNSGFEPQGINERVVRLFDQLPLRWWRMGFDVITEEKPFVEAVKIIQSISKKKIRAYTMIGHEPIEVCKYRCDKVIELGCEPVPQAYIKLNAKSKSPEIMHDWDEVKIKDFQRFYYQPALWRKNKLSDYAPRVDRKRTFAYMLSNDQGCIERDATKDAM
jgi:hypothetical protein